MSIFDAPIHTLDGQATTLADHKGEALLCVNVASQCGFTPQYKGLQSLHDQYAERGFSVLAFPCNQFGGQEPGSAEEIADFCSRNYGVTFPVYEKIDVNGADRHPIFAELAMAEDADGKSGDVWWNFEKFLVGPDGRVLARFRTRTAPADAAVVSAIESVLPTST